MRHPAIFTTSWVLLLLLATAVTAISLLSATRALRRMPDALTPSYTVEQLEATNHDAAEAIRGRRLTAAAFAVGCGLFLAFIVMGPYRRGERWAWWALLVSVGSVSLLLMARTPVMGMRQGASAGVTLGVALLIGLLAGAPRMFAKDNS